jgi:hypothetical protein
MKKLQRLGAATVFIVLLTSATLAGEINTPGIAQPGEISTPGISQPTPPPPASSAMAAGEISESTLLTEIALDLLQIMLSVF